MCATYIYALQMPHIQIISGKHRRQIYVSVLYKYHMNPMQWTMWPGTLVYIHSTLLVFIPGQICLPHCTSHCTSIYYNLHLQYYQKYMLAINIPLNVTNMPHALVIQCAFLGKECQYKYQTRSHFHQWCSQNCFTQIITMMIIIPQPNYVYWGGHLAESAKSTKILLLMKAVL